MSDQENEAEEFDTVFDDNSHRACYIFTPSNEDDDLIDDRPTKRRKSQHTPQTASTSFPLLFNGAESPHCAEIRQDTFRTLWKTAASSIEKVVDQVDDELLGTVATFLDSEETTDRLRVGLTDSGANSGVQSRLLARWKQRRSSETQDVVVVDIQPSHCVNVQSALRNIIRLAISNHSGHDGYQTFVSKFKRLVPMNYDLELLQMFVEANGLTKVVLSLPDIETFDMSIISELLSILHSWLDRVPVRLLMGVNTTIQLFESRLPRAITHLLNIHVLELGQSADFFSKILDKVQYDVEISAPSRLYLGPLAVLSLQELTENQSCGIKTLGNAIKYMYMSHLFANPLSVLLEGNYDKFSPVERSLLAEAIRNTVSFRNFCEKLFSEKKRPLVRPLLSDDAELMRAARSAVSQGISKFGHTIKNMTEMKDLYRHLPRQTSDSSSVPAPLFDLDLKLYASCENLRSAELINDSFATLRTLSHEEMLTLISKLDGMTVKFLGLEEYRQIILRIFDLGPMEPDCEDPESIWPNFDECFLPERITSWNDILPADKDAAYKMVVDQMVRILECTPAFHSFNVTKEFMHEAFLFDSRIPLNTAFNPRPRFAIERALGNPADYLGCECCTTTTSSLNRNHSNSKTNGTTTSGQSPPTSILYNLLQEAGTIINVRDLFEAFKSNTFPTLHRHNDTENGGEEDDEEGDGDESEDQKSQERLALSLFYRSLSELKMLGMVKSSTSAVVKKKALQLNAGGSKSSVAGRYGDIDFIAKTSWAGL